MKRLVLALVIAVPAGPAGPADEPKTESRRQAVLRLSGRMLPNRGGYEVVDVDPNGPAANLRLTDNRPVRGTLEKGDVITEIDGKPFADLREYFDLLNDRVRANGGTVRLTVKDAHTGKAVVWVATPLHATMNVPAKRLDFLGRLGKPVEAAESPPPVGATLKP